MDDLALRSQSWRRRRLRELSGWKSVRMALRYAHVNVDEPRHSIDRLPGGKLGDSNLRKAKSAWISTPQEGYLW
jgi:hypothetical protein